MRDSEEQLLHCNLKTPNEMAMVARLAKIYRPDELPNEEESATPNYLEPAKAMDIRRLHEYYSHPSVNEIKRMAGEWFKKLEVTPKDIEIWQRILQRLRRGQAKGACEKSVNEAPDRGEARGERCW